MNQLASPVQKMSELDRIRDVVGRVRLPDFVRGYTVRLGDFDGEPAMWIEFGVMPHEDATEFGVNRRGDQLVDLSRAVRSEVLNLAGDRFPYFRFHEVAPDAAPT